MEDHLVAETECAAEDFCALCAAMNFRAVRGNLAASSGSRDVTHSRQPL